MIREEKLQIILDNINKIVKKSDAYIQTDKAIEEMSELIRAIVRYRIATSRNDKVSAYENILEEMADVQIMILQLSDIYSIYGDKLYDMMLAKTERTLERLGANDNR